MSAVALSNVVDIGARAKRLEGDDDPEFGGGGPPPGDEAEADVIRIEGGELPSMIGKAIDRLATLPNVYQRAGELVRIVREPDRTERLEEHDRRHRDDIVQRPGQPKIRRIKELRGVLAQCARWQKRSAKAPYPWVAANPPADFNSYLTDAGDWPGIRPLRGLTETPSLAPSGRVVTEPGYDDETGIVLLPSVALDPPLPDKPTQAEAREALRSLWIELFCDFPFFGLGESDASHSDEAMSTRFAKACACPDAFVGIAALLSILARPAIQGATPGTAYEAASQGSGKSLQMHAVSMVATGRPVGLMTFPVSPAGRPDDTELEKILAGYAMAGARTIAFDNVKGELGGAALEKVMTAIDEVDLRVLGSSEIRSMPWAAVLMYSGNNMSMSDDVAQRTMISRLESEREDPRSRPSSDFRHPELLSWIKIHRGELVRCALIVLRAFLVADAKPDVGTWGSFEAWSRLIPAAIVYAGGPNVLDARPREGSVETAESASHAQILTLWPHTLAEGCKTGELIKFCYEDEKNQQTNQSPPDGLDDLRAALRAISHTGDNRIPNAIALGAAFRGVRGKWRDGRKLIGEKSRSGVVVWRVVVRAGAPPIVAPPKPPPPKPAPADEGIGDLLARDTQEPDPMLPGIGGESVSGVHRVTPAPPDEPPDDAEDWDRDS